MTTPDGAILPFELAEAVIVWVCSVICIFLQLDHPEVAPWTSLALAFTQYVPGETQEWAQEEEPQLDVVPSPQSNWNVKGSPSGSELEVLKL